MKRLFRFLIVGLLFVLIAVVFEPIFLCLKSNFGHNVSMPRNGAHLTYELRQLRDQCLLSDNEVEKEEIAKKAVTLLSECYRRIPMSRGWLHHAIAEGLINWDVLVTQEPVIAWGIKKSILRQAQGIIQRLRSHIVDDNMDYGRYLCAVQTLIKHPIANGIFTWEELGSTQEEVDLLIESKRHFTASARVRWRSFFTEEDILKIKQ